MVLVGLWLQTLDTATDMISENRSEFSVCITSWRFRPTRPCDRQAPILLYQHALADREDLRNAIVIRGTGRQFASSSWLRTSGSVDSLAM